jgi:hypothetical protein
MENRRLTSSKRCALANGTPACDAHVSRQVTVKVFQLNEDSAFHARYPSGMQTAHGLNPAAAAVVASAKKTRC